MSQKDSHRDTDSLLSRYLSGELSPEEEKDFLGLIERDASLKVQLEEYRKLWESVGSVSEDVSYDLDAEWSSLQSRLPGFTGSPETRAPGKVRSLLYYTYRIAAVLVVGLVLSLSWYYVTRIAGTEKMVARDEPVEVMLDDGTQILVNRNSTIRFNKNFRSAERRVFLSGEAWFDVARDTTRPFIIEAGDALVEVLGTSFNVNAYKESPVVEITVESGLVALSAKENQEDLIVMKAGSGGTYHKSQKELTLLASSNPNNISWKTRELYFDGSSLGEVLSLLRRVYGAKLVIMDPELESCTITVTFKDQSLDAVLKVLEMTLDLEITRSGDEIRLSGNGCKE